MSKDSAVERRSAKNTLFLQSLKALVAEFARSDNGIKPDELVILFKQNFDRSMLANVDYHSKMAELNKKEGNEAMSALHQLQAEIYRTIATT